MLIRPNEPRGKWNIYIAGFQIAHLLPPSMTDYDNTEYGRMLLGTLARSEASSYNRLIEDMGSDGALVNPFVATACTVEDLDVKRQRSLAYVRALRSRDRECARTHAGEPHDDRLGASRACTGVSPLTATRSSGS